MAYIAPRMTNFSMAELLQWKEWEDANKQRETQMARVKIVFIATCAVVLTAAFVIAAAGATTTALAAGSASAGETAVASGTVAGTGAGGAGGAGAVGNVVYLPATAAKTAKDIAAAASIMLLASPSDAKAAVPDEVLAGRSAPQNLAAWAVSESNDARVLRTLAELGVKKTIEEAVASGDVGLIAISVAPVYERDSDTNPGNRVGMPPLYEQFDVSTYAAEKQRFNRMHFWGSFIIDAPVP